MTSRKRKSFTRGQIVEYWINWEKQNKRVPPWCSHGWDWGEPACMAGGYWLPKWDERKTLKGRWENSGLERCHVIPLVKNGPDELSNLVLMCENCHAMQPDSTDPEVTYAYMRARTLFDCHGVSGVMTKGLLALANGTPLDKILTNIKQDVTDATGRKTQ